MSFAIGLIAGKHPQSWKESYEFSSNEEKLEQVNEKIKVIEDFEIHDPESYRPILERAKTPVALDRVCRSIVLDNLNNL